MVRIIFTAALILTTFWSVAQQPLKTKNVIIVTLDGYRWREVFGGADKKILNKKKYVKDTSVISRFWDDNTRERRAKLMPFFWNVIGQEGQLYGNKNLDNVMRVTNMNVYSYSGYSEMFVGFADKRVRNNDPKVNPNFTVLEALNKDPRYNGRVAVFSTWNIMPYILREEESGLPINTGEDKAKGPGLTMKEKKLNKLTTDHKSPHGDRYDKYTFQYAMEYLKRERPRVLFISLDETDAHAHAGRYDEYLKSAHESDKMIANLWAWVQSQDDYKNQTTLLITTDHGRGKSPRGWVRHAILFRGSAQTWLAAIGPDTPAGGELRDFMITKQSQLAQTIARFMNFDYKQERKTADPIATLFKEEEIEETPVISLGGGGGK